MFWSAVACYRLGLAKLASPRSTTVCAPQKTTGSPYLYYETAYSASFSPHRRGIRSSRVKLDDRTFSQKHVRPQAERKSRTIVRFHTRLKRLPPPCTFHRRGSKLPRHKAQARLSPP